MELCEGWTDLKVVVLSSGGVDSSLTMLMLKKEGHEVCPLHVNYGHLAEEREWVSCETVCKYLELVPSKITLSGMDFVQSGLVHKSRDIEKEAFFPTRNLLFAVLGSSYAYSNSCNVVALGIVANPIFPDQRIEFFKSAEATISAALGVRMKVLTPLATLDKREVLKLARKNGLPLEMTYFCHSGDPIPCGKCISCKERFAAEKILELETQRKTVS